MAKDYFTTTEASKVLSVSPDTVLKWVKAGKITSYRTPGGHYRIPKTAVDRLLPETMEEPPLATTDKRGSGESVFNYCWDFYSDDDEVKAECLECMVYRTRSHRCYEMQDIPGRFTHPRSHCQSECSDCTYYREMHGQETCTLVLTRNRSLLKMLQQKAASSRFSFRFATSEYECASLIQHFRPDYIVVDCSFGATRTRAICQNLMQDERIPVTRIILSSQKSTGSDFCETEIFGWITKPFTLKQLEDLVSGISTANGGGPLMR